MKTCALDIETEPFNAKLGLHLRNVGFICGAVVGVEGEFYFENPHKLSAFLSGYERVYIHNSSFDLDVLRRTGSPLTCPEIVHDTMIMAWLLDENNPINLNDLAKRYLNESKSESIDAFKEGFTPAIGDRRTRDYVIQDAKLCFKLGKLFRGKLIEEGILDLFENIDMPFRRLMDGATNEGVCVNLEALEKERVEVSERVLATKRKFAEDPYNININSPKQVWRALYYFPENVKKQKDGTPKTDTKTLARIPKGYLKPEAQEIINYRKDSKTLNTFIIGLQRSVVPETGLAHPLYNLTTAKTGRTSSGGSRKAYPHSFNIQNVTKKNLVLRKCIQAKPGTSLIVIDAKELELRVLAHYSNDTHLLKVFNEGIDPHSYTASLLFEKNVEDVSDKERSTGKTLNYAVLYGSTNYGLAYNLGIDERVATNLLRTFYNIYPNITKLKSEVERRFLLDGWIQSLYGRKRRGDLNEKEVFSAYISGTAADLMKECAIKSSRVLNPDYKMFLFVHDEFGFYVPLGAEDTARQEIQSAYENGHRPFKAPILFTAEVRHTWGKKESEAS